MSEASLATDWEDTPLNVGDFVIDSRGTVYELRPTEPSIIKQRCHYAARIRKSGAETYENGRGEIIRVGLMFKIDPALVPLTTRKAEPLRRHYYEERAVSVRLRNRQRAAENKKRTDDALRYVSGVRRYE